MENHYHTEMEINSEFIRSKTDHSFNSVMIEVQMKQVQRVSSFVTNFRVKQDRHAGHIIGKWKTGHGHE